MARLTKIVVIVLVADSLLCAVNPRECDVRVESAWPKTVFAPQNSSVYIDCTTRSESDEPFWSVKLADFAAFLSFSNGRTTLNGHGVYAIETASSTLRLLINSTDLNNGTVIQCVYGGGRELQETTLYVYESAPLVYALTADEGTLEKPLSLNISWIDPAEPLRQYNLTVENTDSQRSIFRTDDPYYIFTAPEDAPPCEIYNFSLSASYVGVTYTGDDCGLPPSLEISTMLPSLPDVSRLQSTHNYSLEKLTGEIVLKVYFQPATFCEDYPVTNYTLELTGVQVASSEMKFTSMDNVIVATNLSENAVYIYQLSVTNSVGTVSANITQQIYTTDVQAIRAVEVGSGTEVRLEVEFLPGSTATGSLVILVLRELLGNTTLKVIREGDSTKFTTRVELPKPLFCYHQVYAFGVEADGSVAPLPVPGEITRVNNFTMEACFPMATDTPTSKREPVPELWWIGVAIVIFIAIVVILVVLAVLFRTAYRKLRKHSGRFSIVASDSFEGSVPSPNTLASVPLCSISDKSKKSRKRRTESDGRANDHKATGEVASSPLESAEVTDVRMIHPIINESYLPDTSSGCNGSTNPPHHPDTPNSEPPNYNDICEKESSHETPELSKEHPIEGVSPVDLLGASVTPALDPTYQDTVELSDTTSAPTAHVELLDSADSAQLASSDHIHPGPIYQEVAPELPQRTTPVDMSGTQEMSELPRTSCMDREVVLTPSQPNITLESTDIMTATYPVYQEVSDAMQDAKVSNNLGANVDNCNFIKLSDVHELTAVENGIEHDVGALTPPTVSSLHFGDSHQDPTYDELVECPRVITPVNSTTGVPSQNGSPDSIRLESSTPDSSPVPPYATVTPRSARTNKPENVTEQLSDFKHDPDTPPRPSSASCQDPVPPYATVTPRSLRVKKAKDVSEQLSDFEHSPDTPSSASREDHILPYATVTPPSGRANNTNDVSKRLSDLRRSPSTSPQPLSPFRLPNSTPPPPDLPPRPARATGAPHESGWRDIENPGDEFGRFGQRSPQNSTPPPPNSSPLPAYASIAPRLIRSTEMEDVSQEVPKLDLASPGLHSHHLSPHQSSSGTRNYIPSEEDINLLDEWDDFKIPPGGTLV